MNKNRMIAIKGYKGGYEVRVSIRRRPVRIYIVDEERAKLFLSLIPDPLIEFEDGEITIFGAA